MPPQAPPHPAKPPLRVVISLDVKVGLFCGRCAPKGPGVRNVALLPKLAPPRDEPGFPLTLFRAPAVFAPAAAGGGR